MGETDENCLFCKIVAGEIASDRVAESSLAYAFRDLNPQAPVHVLVVPKRHEPDIGSLAAADPESTIAVLELARQVAESENPPPVDGSVPAGGAPSGSYRLVFNTGPDALQTVFHCHAHVIAGRSLTWPPG
jgi:histidine triad (HIT) family protein